MSDIAKAVEQLTQQKRENEDLYGDILRTYRGNSAEIIPEITEIGNADAELAEEILKRASQALEKRRQLIRTAQEKTSGVAQIAEHMGESVEMREVDPLPPGTTNNPLEYAIKVLERRGQEALHRLDEK